MAQPLRMRTLAVTLNEIDTMLTDPACSIASELTLRAPPPDDCRDHTPQW